MMHQVGGLILVSLLAVNTVHGRVEWFSDKYVMVIDSTPANFLTADARCQSYYGSNLASMHSAEDEAELNDLIFNIAGFIQGRDAWIGANDIAVEGRWGWTDGTPFDYARWHPVEPNNSGNEDCVHLNFASYRMQWNDINCGAQIQEFICNFPDKFADSCDEDSCQPCWPDEDGKVVDGVCDEVTSIRGICKSEYVSLRCPNECGYCSSQDANGDPRFCTMDRGKGFMASPLTGPECGGTYVYISSPCFTDTKKHKLACLFGYSYVEGVRVNSTHYMCVAPPRRPRNGPFTVDLKVKFGARYFDMKERYTYVDQCVGALAGAAGDFGQYLSEGKQVEINWDPSEFYSDKVIILRDRWFSDSFAGNFNRDILKIVENSGSVPLIIPHSYSNERGNEQVQTRISVYPVEPAIENDLDIIELKSNMRTHWADHPDIDSTAVAQDFFQYLQTSKVAAAAQLGLEEENRRPIFKPGSFPGGAGGSAEAYSLCVWSCLATFNHGSVKARAMKNIFIKYQGCGDDRDFSAFNMDVGRDQLGVVMDEDECTDKCLNKLENGALCVLSPTKTCSDYVIDADRCIQLNEDIYGNLEMDRTPIQSSCIQEKGSFHECPCDSPNGQGGGGDGDPHYRTWDSNMAYLHHYQGAGVFYSITSPARDPLGFQGQILTKRKSSSATVSYTYGMAWQKDGYPAISVEYSDTPTKEWFVYWDGNRFDINDPSAIDAVNDDPQSYFNFVFADNQVQIQFDFGIWASYTHYLQFLVRPDCTIKGKTMGGLLGTYDSDVSNDLMNTDYMTYEPVSNYPTWGHQWRVRCEDSLFPRYMSGSACAGNARRLQDGQNCDPLDLFDVCEGAADFNSFNRADYSAKDKARANEICGDYDRMDEGIVQCQQDYLESLDEEAAVLVKDAIEVFNAAIDPPAPEFVCSPICMNEGICIDNGVCQCIGPWSGDYCQDADREWTPTQKPTVSPTKNPTMSPTMSPTLCGNYPETCSEALCYNGRDSGKKDCTATPPGEASFIVAPPDQFQVGEKITGCGTVQCRHCGDVEKCIKTCKDYRKVNGIPVKGTFSCDLLCNGPGLPYVCFFDGGTMECPGKCNAKVCRDLLFPEKHECSSITRDIVDPLNCYNPDTCGYGSVTCDMCGTGAQVKAKCEQWKVDNAGIPEVDAVDCRAEVNAVGPGYKCFAGCLPPPP